MALVDLLYHRVAKIVTRRSLSPSREDAEELKGKVVKKFEKIAPEFVSWLEDNLDEGLTVFDFPRSWWRRIRTINGLERLHREIRRRTRVVGIFPHEASALRLISAVLAEIHEEWLTDRQYLNLAGWKKQVEQFFPTGPKEITEKRLLNPFPLAFDSARSVLAVKGPARWRGRLRKRAK